ncbi:hypothetical protein PG994_002352 [Apiospora phragmitis]|uniref:Uncharacterized protein n=1 Tax=Apiospora phragmitis TaxID=2905665 RepID=A0ABR1WW41_9PEZI
MDLPDAFRIFGPVALAPGRSWVALVIALLARYKMKITQFPQPVPRVVHHEPGVENILAIMGSH